MFDEDPKGVKVISHLIGVNITRCKFPTWPFAGIFITSFHSPRYQGKWVSNDALL